MPRGLLRAHDAPRRITSRLVRSERQDRVFDAGTRITRSELGPAWPLTISNATLHCEFRGEIVVQHRGTGYSLTDHDKHGAYTDIGEIHAEDADGRKKDLGPLIERGKRLCH